MRIHQLPPSVANQIAAGEVIERPASIVKELLENALDAKATEITIDIGYGGLNQVKISDNGQGIVAEDLPLAIAAHATSKINKLTDLYAITSMGFRGEALASIASVSKLSISSKPESQDCGMLMECQHQPLTLSPCARQQGTTIDVRDIFYNAPVRKKFLKSERTEFQAIELVVKRFALGSPSIAITLNHNGKLFLKLPPALDEPSCIARMTKLLGKSFVEQSSTIDIEHAGMRLYGWVSQLSLQRSQSDKLWFYLNGRMVKDKLLNHAIKQAYEGLLHPGRFPACLLYLTMNPALVDVNVHPTKHEVRFQDPRFVHDFIRSNIGKALLTENTVKSPATSTLLQMEDSIQYKSTEQIQSVFPSFQHLMDSFKPATTAVSEVKRTYGVSSWQVLHEKYAIAVVNTMVYLVDIKELQINMTLDSLKEEPLPLAPRPILVPLEFEAVASSVAKDLLLSLGIEIEKKDQSKLLVKSIPKQLPNLTIKPFLTAFFAALNQGELTLNHYLTILASHQSLSGSLMSREQSLSCQQYLEAELTLHASCSFARPLTPAVCREIMNG